MIPFTTEFESVRPKASERLVNTCHDTATEEKKQFTRMIFHGDLICSVCFLAGNNDMNDLTFPMGSRGEVPYALTINIEYFQIVVHTVCGGFPGFLRSGPCYVGWSHSKIEPSL